MKAVAVCVLVFLFGGCATTYTNHVSSSADPSLSACCTYVVVPADKKVDTSAIAWRRFESMVGKLVEQELGYVRGKAGEPAERLSGVQGQTVT
jgi:inhibitor of KinA sporulation pathway (predicted exonuclease)